MSIRNQIWVLPANPLPNRVREETSMGLMALFQGAYFCLIIAYAIGTQLYIIMLSCELEHQQIGVQTVDAAVSRHALRSQGSESGNQ
jgi:hypothetical protein